MTTNDTRRRGTLAIASPPGIAALDAERLAWLTAVAEDWPADAYGKATALALVKHMSSSGACWPSLATIAREAGVNVRTARSRLDQLRADGFLRWERPNPYKPTRYQATIPLDRDALRVQREAPAPSRAQDASRGGAETTARHAPEVPSSCTQGAREPARTTTVGSGDGGVALERLPANAGRPSADDRRAAIRWLFSIGRRLDLPIVKSHAGLLEQAHRLAPLWEPEWIALVIPRAELPEKMTSPSAVLAKRLAELEDEPADDPYLEAALEHHDADATATETAATPTADDGPEDMLSQWEWDRCLEHGLPMPSIDSYPRRADRVRVVAENRAWLADYDAAGGDEGAARRAHDQVAETIREAGPAAAALRWTLGEERWAEACADIGVAVEDTPPAVRPEPALT